MTFAHLSAGQMASLRVFIASPDEKLRLALMVFVDKEPGMVVAGLSDRIQGLQAQLQGAEPDVLLLDCAFAPRSRSSLLASLRGLEPHTVIVAFATRPQDEEAIMKEGADYFISKEAPPDRLIPILNEIRSSGIKGGAY